MKFLTAIFFFFVSVVTMATDDVVAEKARQRLYDGGIDEQPLQVQSALYNPKMEGEKTGEGEAAPTEPQGATRAIDEVPED
jgi:hypothetical protein